MKLLIDNDPGFEVTLRTEDGRATVKIPIRKGGFENDATALLAAARFRASGEMYRALDQMVFAITLLSDTTARKLEKHMEAARTALALADNTNETLSQ